MAHKNIWRKYQIQSGYRRSKGKGWDKALVLYGRKLLGGDVSYLAGRETQMGIVVRDL